MAQKRSFVDDVDMPTLEDVIMYHPKSIRSDMEELQTARALFDTMIALYERAEQRAIAAHTDGRMFTLTRGGTASPLVPADARECCWMMAMPDDLVEMIYTRVVLARDRASWGAVCKRFARMRYAQTRRIVGDIFINEPTALPLEWARLPACRKVKLSRLIRVSAVVGVSDAAATADSTVAWLRALRDRIDWRECQLRMALSPTTPPTPLVPPLAVRRLKVVTANPGAMSSLSGAISAYVACGEVTSFAVKCAAASTVIQCALIADGIIAAVRDMPLLHSLTLYRQFARYATLPPHVRVLRVKCDQYVCRHEFPPDTRFSSLWFLCVGCDETCQAYIMFAVANQARAAELPMPVVVGDINRHATRALSSSTTRMRIGYTTTSAPTWLTPADNVEWVRLETFDRPYSRWIEPFDK